MMAPFNHQNFTAFDAINISMLTVDTHFRILYANKKACELLLLNKTPYQLDNLFRYAKFIRNLPENDLRDTFSDSLEKQNTLALSEDVQLLNAENQLFSIDLTLSPFLDESQHTLGAILIFNDVSGTQVLSQKLLFQANHDELTGLSNRNLFLENLKNALSAGQSYNQKFALLFVDLDGFKKINDTLGHNYGDILLQQVAERLKKCIRDSDSLARLGGDEFTILLHQLEKNAQAARVADSILNELASPFNLMGIEASVSASIGIAHFPEDGSDKDTLLKNADSAMYHAKEHGKNNYQFYTSSINDKSLEKLRLSNDMRRAIELNEFELHYQPQYNVVENTMVGVEALLRWYHPVMGFVPPSDFIPLAEESSRIKNIGAWVLEEACKQIQIWKRHGLTPPPVAVNLSVNQIEPKLVNHILEILNEFKVHPKEIEFEITETIFAQDTKQILAILFELKSHDFNIALDDFGTGYSSLSYLGKMPIDIIKIDQSFIRDLDEKTNQSIVKTILAMGKELNKRVIAEGVQTNAQKDFLLENGCVFMQGFLFSKPIMPAKLTILMKQGI